MEQLGSPSSTSVWVDSEGVSNPVVAIYCSASDPRYSARAGPSLGYKYHELEHRMIAVCLGADPKPLARSCDSQLRRAVHELVKCGVLSPFDGLASMSGLANCSTEVGFWECIHFAANTALIHSSGISEGSKEVSPTSSVVGFASLKRDNISL